jgi:hypothetical protein
MQLGQPTSLFTMNTTYKVGRSAEENWKLILAADKEYYWLHAGGAKPSAHIIIEIFSEPTVSELARAAQLCNAQTKSSYKHFVYAQIKDVRLGSKPGQVTLKQSQEFYL